MPRPTKAGHPARKPRHRKLSELYLRRVKKERTAFNTWDTYQRGLVLRVQPSGHRSWKVVYRYHGRPRWYHIGDAKAVGLTDARKLAQRIMLAAAEGKDPATDRKAERSAGTLAELHAKYLDEHAKKHNKSWQQSAKLVVRYVLPRLGKLPAKDVTRNDIETMVSKIAAPVLANQVLAAISAVLSWGLKKAIVEKNPVIGIDRNPTTDRERVLSDTEIPQFWAAFDDAGLVAGTALKVLLLTGQRPGEVAHMRREHIVDGWWAMPGAPDKFWPGTKNAQSHRVWLAAPVLQLLAEMAGEPTPAPAPAPGYVFAGPRGRAIGGLDAAMRAICAKLGAPRATPHDLRRTFSSRVTELGFGRPALNRLTNHKEGGIADVYDRHNYAAENQRIMAAVAGHILALAQGRGGDGKVVEFKR